MGCGLSGWDIVQSLHSGHRWKPEGSINEIIKRIKFTEVSISAKGKLKKKIWLEIHSFSSLTQYKDSENLEN